MTNSVAMPHLGESVTEGTVTRWLKQEGDRVHIDEPLLEVSTDKVDTEVLSPASGTVVSIKVHEDETVEVGVELALIADSSHSTSSGATSASADAQPPIHRNATTTGVSFPTPLVAGAGTTVATTQGTKGPHLTLLVRRLAREQQVDLSTIAGTGAGGRIRKSDVLTAASPVKFSAPPALKPPRSSEPSAPAGTSTVIPRGKTERMSRLRQVIADRMVNSLRTSAQLTTVFEVDVTKVARLRDQTEHDFARKEGAKLSFLPFFAVATLEALADHPVFNSSVGSSDGGEPNTITYYDDVHLGFAVDTDRGLLVPVIHNANDLNLAGLARKMDDAADSARAHTISPDELNGGTFTLTNTGSRGALFDTPIINQPQVAILGIGAVVKRPTAVTHPEFGETIAIRSMVHLALTYDHRVIDGADAARFLGTIKDRLESGAFDRSLGTH